MKSMRIGVAGIAGGCPRRENNSNNGREERRKGKGGNMSTRRKLTTWAGAVAALAWVIAGLPAAHAQTTTDVYASTGANLPENRNLQNAIDASEPGDTLILHGAFPWWDGREDGTARITTVDAKTNLTLIADATDGASKGGNQRAALYIAASSNITVIGIEFLMNRQKGIDIANNNTGVQTISNCTIRLAGDPINATGVYALSTVKVVDCRVGPVGVNGIDVRNALAPNSLILNNTVTNCPNGNGILLWSTGVAMGNRVSHCSESGISGAGGIDSPNNVVVSNIVHHCGTGLQMQGRANNTKFRYNVAYSNTVGIGLSPNAGHSGYEVHHNTVYGNGTGIRIAWASAHTANNVGYNQVAANIVVGNDTGIDFVYSQTIPSIMYSAMWNNTTDYANQADTATKTGVVSADPGFHSTDPANKRFLQLGPATPAAVLTTGDDSLWGGAAYMGAIEPYFPAGTVLSIR